MEVSVIIWASCEPDSWCSCCHCQFPPILFCLLWVKRFWQRRQNIRPQVVMITRLPLDFQFHRWSRVSAICQDEVRHDTTGDRTADLELYDCIVWRVHEPKKMSDTRTCVDVRSVDGMRHSMELLWQLATGCSAAFTVMLRWYRILLACCGQVPPIVVLAENAPECDFQPLTSTAVACSCTHRC